MYTVDLHRSKCEKAEKVEKGSRKPSEAVVFADGCAAHNDVYISECCYFFGAEAKRSKMVVRFDGG